MLIASQKQAEKKNNHPSKIIAVIIKKKSLSFSFHLGNSGISETESQVFVMTSPSLYAVSQAVTIKMKFATQYNVQ